jgi:hypothetical protein|tara:strand:- start:308 stop:508 length:201 start_codon:yes stop_codon:yes gene_type:complete
MKPHEKIEEMIKNAEKKVHAGEWLRIEQVRVLMNQFGIWMIEREQEELRNLKHNILSDVRKIGEEE